MKEKSAHQQSDFWLRIHQFRLQSATSLQILRPGEIAAWFPSGHRLRLRLVDPAQQDLAEKLLLQPESDVDLSKLFQKITSIDVGYPEGVCPF